MKNKNIAQKTRLAANILLLIATCWWAIAACSKSARTEVGETSRPAPTQTLENTATPKALTETPTGEEASRPEAKFDGERALADVKFQVSLGPRIPNTQAHEKVVAWIKDELEKAGWNAEVQETAQMGHPVQNVIGKRENGQPWIILGAHYDSRIFADQDGDPQKAKQPVPGANDGASGVAVLLELARVLPSDVQKQVWLVFFDVEDNGNITGWDWILGSRAFVQSLKEYPQAAVIIDMIGDADLNIYKEQNSNPILTEAIWAKAAQLGYSQFQPRAKYRMLDDHTPFLQAGIPAIDIIDFDYPYWHKSEDTPDKISAESLKAVGDTLRAWLTES